MMTTEATTTINGINLRSFLQHLHNQHVQLWVDEGQLRVKASKDLLTPEIVQVLKTQKAAIIDFLQRVPPASGQQEALSDLLKSGPLKSAGTNRQGIVPISRQGALPLSSAQQRFWFLDQLGSGQAYSMPVALRLQGKLDVAALEHSLQTIIARHEILRTTYQTTGETVYQVVQSAPLVELPLIDLQMVAPDAQQAEVEKLLATEGRRAFDLSNDLMQRHWLVKLAEQEHVLLISTHHIAYDAWSAGCFNAELATLYNAFVQGLPSPLPSLPIQYADFAHWQQQQDLAPQLAYWQQQLQKPLPLLELPLDYPRPELPDHRGARVLATIPAPQSSALRRLAQQEGGTLFMVLLALFNLLLHRLTRQEDIIIGTPSIGRNHPETEQMLGLFINTLVLRTDLRPTTAGDALTFRTLLQRAREVTLDAFAHQDAPFEKLVEVIQPDRLPGRDPIYEVMLNLVNIPKRDLHFHGLEAEVWGEEAPDALRPLTLYVEEYAGEEHAGELRLELLYQRALFQHERMVSFVDQFHYLAAQVVENPDQPLHAFSLVTPKSRPMLPDLCEELPMPEHEPITARLLEWAEHTPEQIAVEWQGRCWSYAELGQAAEQVARGLMAHGVKPGDVVAIHGRRSFGLVASIFGTLLSGGVMLTLDAALPPARQTVMMDEGKATVVLAIQTDEIETEIAHLSAPHRRLFAVDAYTGSLPFAVPETLSRPALQGRDPAYIFFTSGTTGIPKGILGLHHGLAHFLQWQSAHFAIVPEDRFAQYTGLSFDVVLRDMFLPLISGATLCIPQDSDMARSLAWLQEQEITVLHTVPSLAQAWLRTVHAGFCHSALRWTFFAGEPLLDLLVMRWCKRFPNTAVVNLYGPSETTLAKCFYQVSPQPIPGIQPVGHPLPQTQILILNTQTQQCGIGEPGEIVIRTPFRTAGYINNPAEQKRFVVNPLRTDSEDWLYYTGDRGGYRPDGTIAILGRMDDQIKIRGIRVELAEVNFILKQHPAIMESAVLVQKEDIDGYSEERLIAYVVLQDNLQTDDLRHYLSQRLHAALVPSAIMVLDALPVTHNGKLDRRALPNPVYATAQYYGAPRNVQEQVMVELWQEALCRQSIGIHDNFFELGGHSLSAVHLMAKIQQKFGEHLALATLFSHATVATLTACLTQPNSGWSPLVPIQPKGNRPPLFCVPGLGGNVLYYYALAHYLDVEQPLYGLQALGLDGVTPPHTSIEAMAADYIALIRQVQPRGPYQLVGQSFGGRVVFEMAQQLMASGEDAPTVLLLDCSSPFDTLTDESAARDEVDLLSEIASVLGQIAGKRLVLPVDTLRALSDVDRLKAFIDLLEGEGLIPVKTDVNFVRGWLNVYKSSYQMSQSYHKKTTQPLSLVYFQASEYDDVVLASHGQSRITGWRAVGNVTLHVASGSHLSMMTEPHVQTLAKQITEVLHYQATKTSEANTIT